VRKKLIAAAAAASLLAVPALAREGAWMGIGVRPINAATTSQTIEVSDTNVPRETMFCTDDSQVQILTADFHYRNGDAQTVPVRTRIRAGDCSRVIGLRNRTAELASVTFTADPASLTAGATARVRVLVR
jgi:hypothetical protein